MTEAPHPGLAALETNVAAVVAGAEQAYLDAQAALEAARARVETTGQALASLCRVVNKEILGPYSDKDSFEPTFPPTAQNLYDAVTGVYQRHPNLFPEGY